MNKTKQYSRCQVMQVDTGVMVGLIKANNQNSSNVGWGHSNWTRIQQQQMLE